MKRYKIQYNSPVILSFSLLSLIVLLLDKLTGGGANARFFSVYRSSFASAATYVRLFGHVLGHTGFAHYTGNILLLLIVGPAVEERYGSWRLLIAIAATALVTGLVHMLLFPHSALLGASGIVFMVIVMSSFAGRRDGAIPLTLILVILIYLGGELVDGLTVRDNISQLTHILGGVCGTAFGFLFRNRYKPTDGPHRWPGRPGPQPEPQPGSPDGPADLG